MAEKAKKRRQWNPIRSHDNFPPEHREIVNAYYKHRPMLNFGSNYTDRPQLSIMTYNLLHPCETYPESSFSREQILMFEIARYNPDIVCLQEVDDHFRWIERFAKFGYNMRVAHPNEFHAIAICYKWELFQEYDHSFIKFCEYEASCVSFDFANTHGALFVCLFFRPEFLKGHKPPSKHGVIVACTHLPLTGIRAFTRTRDAAILLEYTGVFEQSVRDNRQAKYKFYTFIAGDFNATTNDPTFLALTQRPLKFYGRFREMLIRSINDTIMPVHDAMALLGLKDAQPGVILAVSQLERFHNWIQKRAISLYSLGYGTVHKNNTQANEPKFSHWGTHSQELFDYIFLVTDYDASLNERRGAITNPNVIAKKAKVKLLALLRMPTRAEMGLKNISQPVLGEYPSDHLCMMADLELL